MENACIDNWSSMTIDCVFYHALSLSIHLHLSVTLFLSLSLIHLTFGQRLDFPCINQIFTMTLCTYVSFKVYVHTLWATFSSLASTVCMACMWHSCIDSYTWVTSCQSTCNWHSYQLTSKGFSSFMRPGAGQAAFSSAYLRHWLGHLSPGRCWDKKWR